MKNQMWRTKPERMGFTEQGAKDLMGKIVDLMELEFKFYNKASPRVKREAAKRIKDLTMAIRNISECGVI